MADIARRRHGSFVGPVILIFLGVLFLLWNFRPDFDPWPILWRYWPLILVFVGLGKIWDSYWARRHPEEIRPSTGVNVAWIALLLLFLLAVWHGRANWQRWQDGYTDWRWHDGIVWHGRGWNPGARSLRDTQAIDLQGAKSASVHLQMPAGELVLSGGSSHLLDAEFRYDQPYAKPEVNYAVTGGHGQLDITQNSDGMQFGPRDNDWQLRFGGDAPIDLKLEMGAGRSDIRLGGLSVSHLDIQMGAGEMNLDLTGERNRSLTANVEGGAGQATIHLPKDACVRVHASGGIGAINTRGMQRDGEDYVNGPCATASGMDLTVHGGVGEINLLLEP